MNPYQSGGVFGSRPLNSWPSFRLPGNQKTHLSPNKKTLTLKVFNLLQIFLLSKDGLEIVSHIPIPTMCGIFTYIYLEIQPAKCSQIYHTWMVWVSLCYANSLSVGLFIFSSWQRTIGRRRSRSQ